MAETLFDCELFGYEKGVFTGATHRKQELVEAASGGTLFLDEIGGLPLALQVKLLRLLETGTYRRVGGLDWLPADFRLITVTHRELRPMVQDGSFRRDLCFRINIFPVRTPALHERADDIPLLATSLLERVDRKSDRRSTPSVLAWLAGRRYSGNIRELRNLIECATPVSYTHLDVYKRQGNDTPPAVWFAYSPNRKGEHPQTHLKSFKGILQADAFAGFDALYAQGDILEAACWAHARRKFFEIHQAQGLSLIHI